MYMKEQYVSAAECCRRQPDPSDYLMEFDVSSSLGRMTVRLAISGVTVSTGNHTISVINQK
jgi:hypothetical protein